MPARLAYPMFYRTIRDPLDEDGRLKLEAILGDPVAQAEVDRRRLEAVLGAGGVLR